MRYTLTRSRYSRDTSFFFSVFSASHTHNTVTAATTAACAEQRSIGDFMAISFLRAPNAHTWLGDRRPANGVTGERGRHEERGWESKEERGKDIPCKVLSFPIIHAHMMA